MNVRGFNTQGVGSYEDEGRTSKRRFRYVYVIKPGPYNLSSIEPQCEQVIYATDGTAETVGEMYEQLSKGLEDFDPNKDLLIAVGSANSCVLAATIITKMIFSSGKQAWDSYCLAVYTSPTYLFWRVPVLGPLTEPYEFTDI